MDVGTWGPSVRSSLAYRGVQRRSVLNKLTTKGKEPPPGLMPSAPPPPPPRRRGLALAATATISKDNKFCMALLGPCKVGQLMRPRTHSYSASSPLTLRGRVVALSSIGVSTYDICKIFAYATPLPHLSGCIHDHVTYHHCCPYSTTPIECGRHLW